MCNLCAIEIIVFSLFKLLKILLIFSSEITSDELDISSLDAVSTHAFDPILKDDEDIAKMATSVHAYLFMYKGEKDVKLSELIYKFMRENGIDDPVDVWKPIGLGRKNWHNLITRYEKEEGKKAKKLTLLYVAIALRLNIDQTRELLENQFHRLTKSKQDLIFTYHIVNREIEIVRLHLRRLCAVFIGHIGKKRRLGHIWQQHICLAVAGGQLGIMTL